MDNNKQRQAARAFVAHHANGNAVKDAYGFPKDATDSDFVAQLFNIYQKLTTL